MLCLSICASPPGLTRLLVEHWIERNYQDTFQLEFFSCLQLVCACKIHGSGAQRCKRHPSEEEGDDGYNVSVSHKKKVTREVIRQLPMKRKQHGEDDGINEAL